MNPTPRRRGLAAALLIFSAAGAAPAQTATFSGLGTLSGDSRAFGLSPDGTVVVGESGGQAFVWSAATGLHALGGLRATGASNNGTVLCGYSGSAGNATSFHSVRWTAWSPGAMQDLHTFASPSNTGSMSTAHAITPDGSVIVGNAWNGDTSIPDTVPYRWTAPGGAAFLRGPSGYYSATMGYGPTFGAQAVSADGSVVVGNDSTGPQAFRWTPGTHQNLFDGLSAQALTPEGNTVVGYHGPPTGTQRAFVWRTGAPPTMSDLPPYPGGTGSSRAYGVSADASRIVGEASVSGGTEAFLWDTPHGTRSLRQVLVASGAPAASGWTLTSARAISANGNVVAGYGTNPQGQTRAWIATLPPACYANCDGSTADPVLDSSDFNCFIIRYLRGDSWANCDGSTAPPVLNILDFICFQNRFAEGCP